MNRIETNYIELYVEGEKSGSRTVTLTCVDPIEVTYEQFTNRLNGVVNVSITDNFTTEVKFNISFSDLWKYGEIYNGVITAKSGDDILKIPVVINCSDTLIYSDVPRMTIIDVLDGIHINYSSVPDVNKVWFILEDGKEIDITSLMSNQSIHLTYEMLLSRFGVIDYDYICATNGLSQIAHKLKKVVYKFEVIGDSDIYIDYREQWVEFKFLSTRNDEFMTFTYNSAFDGLQYEFDVDDDYVVTMRVKVPVNFDKERVIPIVLTQDESKYIIRFSIIQEKGVLDFKFKSPNPMYIDREEQIIDVKILSFASGEYPLPIIGILPVYMQHISTTLNEEGVYVIKLKIDKNESFKRGGKIQFTQTDFGGVIYLNYSQDGDKFIPDGDGGSEDDEGNILYGLLGFWGLDKDQYKEQDDDLTEKYSYVQRQYDSDGNEIYVELESKLIKLSGEDYAEIVDWENQYDNDYYNVTEYARGVYTKLDLSNISIIPKTKDVGQLLFYRSQLNELNSLDLPLVNTREMFFHSNIKTIGTKDTPLDLNGVEIANGMFDTSHAHTIYINNTHNIKMAFHMFYACGAGEGTKLNINGEDGVYLDLSGAENIGALFEMSGYISALDEDGEMKRDWGLHSIKELKLTKNCKYAAAAFSGCYNLIDLPLIDCSGIEDAEWFLSGCEALRNVGGFKGFKVDLDLEDCIMLTHESMLNIINNLADVRYLGGRRLTLHENHLNMLSDDELYLAVKKGWTIVVNNVIIDMVPISEENECIYIAKESTGNELYNPGNIMANDTSVIDAFLNDTPHDGYRFDGTVGVRYNYKFKVRGTNYDSLFGDCLYRVVKLDTSNAYSTGGLFSGCGDLISIPEINISNSNNMGMMFFDCSSLTTIPLLDTSLVTSLYYAFGGCALLTNLGGFKNLKVDLDLSGSPLLTHESLMNVINNLTSVTNKTLSLGETNLAKLTDEEKIIAINKGWTLS